MAQELKTIKRKTKDDEFFTMYKDLALEIIAHAINDLKNNTIYELQSLQIEADKNKSSAKKFFKSEWFEFLCDCLNINDKIILEKLKENL